MALILEEWGMDWIVTGLAAVGAIVVGYFLLMSYVEFLRCVYWAAWETYAVSKCLPDKVTAKNVIKALWLNFKNEYSGDYQYTSRSCKYYSHGFYPWEEKHIFDS